MIRIFFSSTIFWAIVVRFVNLMACNRFWGLMHFSFFLAHGELAICLSVAVLNLEDSHKM